MKVERYNYAEQFGPDPGPLLADIRKMLLTGRFILSEEVSRFESEFARYLGVAQVRGVNSGTDALWIALRALGVAEGDEVITHANAFYATVAAIRHAGGVPILVDAAEDSFLMNESEAAAAITPRTRVLLPVHLYGKPTPMTHLMTLARRRGLAIV